MKYIMLKNEFQYLPIIFADFFVHRDIFQAVSRVGMQLVSAGEYCPVTGICSGRSETLNKSSRGVEDSQIIAYYDLQHGII